MKTDRSIPFGVSVILAGLMCHAGLPRGLGAKFTYDPNYEARKTAERGRRKSNFVRPIDEFGTIDPKLTRAQDPTKVFHFLIEWPGEMPRHGSVTINLKTGRIDTSGEALFNKDHSGARGGVLLISAPFAALCIVPIAITRGYYRAREEREGMSRHAWDLYCKLGPQLDPADAAFLREALCKTWEHEQWRKRKVTHAEAQRLLATCYQRLETLEDDGSIPHDATVTTVEWYTEPTGGERIAGGSFGKDGLGEITVLGSRFHDIEAQRLCGSFRGTYQPENVTNT